ncbi:TIGR02679 domain-containing protein [Paenibacillus hodogayensis]|uniref:TIGR02679 domain-containing protein n=1 Tax=Paenibacillus hodogayensis TaxID=279208 RepID=A0ABV5VWV7_9BACL
MQDNRQLVEIFRQSGGFGRLFDLYCKKFESYGAFGTVPMRPTEEEEKALRGFLGIRYKGPRFPAADFEKAAREAGYSVSLLELLELYYGHQLSTKRQQKESKLSAWANLFIQVELDFITRFNISNTELEIFIQQTFNWFQRLKEGDAKGYRVLRTVFDRDTNVYSELLTCLSALWHLLMRKDEMFERCGISTGKIRLPMFAAYVTEDSHAFDKTNAKGRLLWSALNDINSQSLNQNGNIDNHMSAIPEYLFERQIYRNFDVLDDDLSSISHVFVPHLVKGTSPRTLNLREIEEMEQLPKYSSIYILENPSVISYLVDETIHFLNLNEFSLEQLPPDFPVLLCTIGQARTASKVFIEKCLEASPNCIIYYSGDLDVPGIQMLNNMKEQFTAEFYAWRMETSIYRNHVATKSKPLSDADLKILQELEGGLAKEMIQIKAKVYQELFGKELRGDWIKEVSSGISKMNQMNDDNIHG